MLGVLHGLAARRGLSLSRVSSGCVPRVRIPARVWCISAMKPANDIAEFCKLHDAYSEVREWALANCASEELATAWYDAEAAADAEVTAASVHAGWLREGGNPFKQEC